MKPSFKDWRIENARQRTISIAFRLKTSMGGNKGPSYATVVSDLDRARVFFDVAKDRKA